jgi:hypothetical protein
MAGATAIATDQAEHQLDQLDASLDDFAPSIGSPRLPFGYPSAHSGFRSDDTASEAGASDSGASAGGYSPPAWRRLGNGDRSSGFWRKTDNNLMDMYDDAVRRSRESSPEYESADEGDEILAQAIRTRLPTGSLSPEKERSPEPEYYPAQQHLIDEAINLKQEDLDARLALSALKDAEFKPKELAENCRSRASARRLLCLIANLCSQPPVARHSICCQGRSPTPN